MLLLTSGHEQVARRVADALGIADIAWNLKPTDKMERDTPDAGLEK